MKTILLVLLVVTGIIAAPQGVDELKKQADKTKEYKLAPAGYYNISGNEFYITEGSGTWYDGDAMCKAQGMYLVSLQTVEKNDMITNYFYENDIYAPLWTSAMTTTFSPYWSWVSTGEIMYWSNWGFWEPMCNGANPCCGYLHGYYWYAGTCSAYYWEYYIFQSLCENL